MLKVHILFQFLEGPSGGGNQFLRALRDLWRESECYAESPMAADVILFNSHHHLRDVWKLRLRFPEKTFVHRVDGPISIARGRDRGEDGAIIAANAALADGTVFQSKWSREANIALGLAPPNDLQTIIFNAPSSAHFHRVGRSAWSRTRPTRLIATSWSPNFRKGFHDYLSLERALDFARYEMTFVGNSPVRFARVRMVAALPNRLLGNELRAHDIYVTGSRSESCSNALLEALHCGLPTLGFADSSNPELIGDAGLLYRDPAEMVGALDLIVADYPRYQSAIALPDLTQVAAAYHAFCSEVRRSRAAKGRSWSLKLARALARWKYEHGVDLVRAKIDAARKRAGV